MSMNMNETSKQFIKTILRSCSVVDKEEIIHFILEGMDRFEQDEAVVEISVEVPVEEANEDPPVEVVPPMDLVDVEYIPLSLGMVQPVEESKTEPEDMYPNIQGVECLAMRWKIYLTHLPAIITNSPDHELLSMTPTRIEFRKTLGSSRFQPIQYVCSNGTANFDTINPRVSKIFRHLNRNMKYFTERGTPVMVLERGVWVYNYVVEDVKIKNIVMTRGRLDYKKSLVYVFPYPSNSTIFFDERRANECIILNISGGYGPITPIPHTPPRVIRRSMVVSDTPPVTPIPHTPPRVIRRSMVVRDTPPANVPPVYQKLVRSGKGNCPVCYDECETKLSNCGHPICRTCANSIFNCNYKSCPLCRCAL